MCDSLTKTKVKYAINVLKAKREKIIDEIKRIDEVIEMLEDAIDY